jgi:hypothetical protein
MFLERIVECHGTERSNCIGTALYISGEQPNDRLWDIYSVHASYLQHLAKTRRPILGCLAAWEREYAGSKIAVAHMGVITSLHPLLITERHETVGAFITDQPFPIIHKEYNKGLYAHKVSFYIPNLLQQNDGFSQNMLERMGQSGKISTDP